MASARELVEVLGGPKVVGSKVKDLGALQTKIRQGLPYASYVHLTSLLAASLEEVGRIINLPPRTRARRRQHKKLEPDESDRLVRLARAMATAASALGDANRAAQWLHRPNRALGGKPPLQLLDNEVGEQLVQEVLGRIEYGAVS
jgi:putative toxin-antitoxin system antitoxin component (TIGR02293 family)